MSTNDDLRDILENQVLGVLERMDRRGTEQDLRLDALERWRRIAMKKVVYVSISTAQLYGVQVPNTKVVSKAEHNPTVFCEAPHTGQLSWFADEQCRGNQQAHAITWDGSFEACQNNFTGKLRRAATCTPNEKPVVI